MNSVLKAQNMLPSLFVYIKLSTENQHNDLLVAFYFSSDNGVIKFTIYQAVVYCPNMYFLGQWMSFEVTEQPKNETDLRFWPYKT